ncbi:MAG: hypothetical protein HGA74_15485 [Deltaproteobacteria bacterium]|nr:hypothetical protein [Deltaproteobacteria bacterium]
MANISASVPPLPVDLILGDEGLSLEPYGIAGQVIHTPGHTQGSVSILLEGGHALVGDLAMAMPPLRFRPGLSTFGSDMETLKASARTDARVPVFPAAGPSTPSPTIPPLRKREAQRSLLHGR